MILLVDIGNTRVKWATYESGRLGASNAAAYTDWDIPDWRSALLSRQPVARVLAAAVAGSASRDKLAAAAASCDVPIQFVTTSASAGGVRNAYPDPSLLGIDRWIAMIGARHLRAQACCIVDIGTAATVDAVTADGVHLGGFIVPGPQLMVQSLLAGTSDLASHAARSGSVAGASALFANNTREAIERGCRIALAALVDRAYRELAAGSPTPPALLGTGGAVEEIAPYVLAPLEVVPDLVLHGLATLADAGT